MPVTRDRGDVIHYAGRQKLSPALRDGAPALVAHGEPGDRCGWATFFAAMSARRLALEIAPDGAGHRLVPSMPQASHGRSSPLAEARRFLAALRGVPPEPGGSR